MTAGQLPATRELNLPPPRSASSINSISATGSVVIVGANGSGKTRLGSWLDISSTQSAIVHRVAAQKSLSIPEFCSTSSLDVAENALLYGYPHPGAGHEYKVSYRWQSNPNTFLQSDYEKLLTYLFTDEFEQSSQYRQHAKEAEGRITPPETRLDTIKRIWESALPHRQLLIGAGKIQVCLRNGSGSAYHSSELSDGERVIFYLIGQSLAAKKDGIIVIDEPELHLHRSLQKRLWDAIEAERPDCLFVYLTHDLDFAAARLGATKIWLRDYENGRWDWHILDQQGEIPERLLLEILGSRKVILFVEGERESLEYFIFSKLYPDHTVVPCGSASSVIYGTRSFSALKQLHSLECCGIVDRDFRSDSQVEYLRQRQVFCLAFSEIENLLLDERVLRSVADFLRRDDSENIVNEAKSLVLSRLGADKERVLSAIVAARIEASLTSFNAKARGLPALQQAMGDMIGSIDVQHIYRSTETEIDAIIARSDYEAALRLYNNKGLVAQVSGLFGFKPQELRKQVVRIIGSKDNNLIIDALRAAAPEIEEVRHLGTAESAQTGISREA